MKTPSVLLLVLGLLGSAGRSLGAESAPPPLKVTAFTHNRSHVERLAKYEATITLNKSWDNPYDHAGQVEVNAYFALPNGGVSKTAGFWYEGFQRSLRANTEQFEATTVNGWMFRFSPKTTGVYRYYVEVIDRSNQGSTLRYPAVGFLSFTATPSANKGFLAVGKRDATYLEYEDGSLYIGLGHNLLGWEWSGSSNSPGTYDYDRWLERLAASGGNMAQFDFCEGDQIEWTPHPTELSYSSAWQGLGRYNQKASWRMDHIVSKAEQLGVFFRLCFSHWEDFDHEAKGFPDWGWARNPYNSANGGPVATVTEFFTDKKAKEYYQRYLRYIVARWGYNKNILTYEVWNEADAPHMIWGTGHNYKSNQANILEWHREMSAYLKSLDPHHLVTTSFANNLNQDSIWKLPDIDLTTIHRYPAFNQWIDGGFKKFEVEECLTYLIRKRAESDPKPVLVGEFTVSPFGLKDTHDDPTGIAFHNQLWVSIMQGALGTAMHWQWDYYLDAFDLYYHYKPLAAFLAGEDLRNMTAFTEKGAAANAYGRKSRTKAYVWIHDAKHTFIDRHQAHGTITGHRCELTDMESGKYALQFLDPYSGALLREFAQDCLAGKMSIPIPEFSRDVAVKVKRVGN